MASPVLAPSGLDDEKRRNTHVPALRKQGSQVQPHETAPTESGVCDGVLPVGPREEALPWRRVWDAIKMGFLEERTSFSLPASVSKDYDLPSNPALAAYYLGDEQGLLSWINLEEGAGSRPPVCLQDT